MNDTCEKKYVETCEALSVREVLFSVALLLLVLIEFVRNGKGRNIRGH